MANVIEVKITGGKELQTALEQLPKKVADKIMMRACTCHTF